MIDHHNHNYKRVSVLRDLADITVAFIIICVAVLILLGDIP